MQDISGRYFDGKTAKAHPVNLQWRADAVELLNTDGNGIVIWPLDDIRLKDLSLLLGFLS